MGAPEANKKRWEEIRATGKPPEHASLLGTAWGAAGMASFLDSSLPSLIKAFRSYRNLSPIEKIQTQSLLGETALYFKGLFEDNDYKKLKYQDPNAKPKSTKYYKDSPTDLELEHERKRQSMLSED